MINWWVVFSVFHSPFLGTEETWQTRCSSFYSLVTVLYTDNCNAHIIPSSQTTSKMCDPLPVLGAMRNPLPCMAWDDDIVLSVDVFFFLKRFLKKELGPRTAKLALLRIKFIKYGIKQFLLLNMKIWRKTQLVYTYILNIHC